MELNVNLNQVHFFTLFKNYRYFKDGWFGKLVNLEAFVNLNLAPHFDFKTNKKFEYSYLQSLS